MIPYAKTGRQEEAKPHHQEKTTVLRSHAIEIISNSNYCGHPGGDLVSFCQGAEVGAVHPGMFKKHTHTLTHKSSPTER